MAGSRTPRRTRYAPRSKQSPYEGGLRTPILVRWPGKVAPRTCDIPVSAIDVAPTILRAAGLEPQPGMEGVNLLDEKAVAGRPAVFGEVFTHNAVNIHDPASSLRFRWAVEGDWKLIVPERRNEPDGVVELFDVVHDPGETRNVAVANRQKVVEMLVKLDTCWMVGRR